MILFRRLHEELWVPAEEMEDFNRHILGAIEIIEAYTGSKFQGSIDPATHLPLGIME